MGRPSTSEAFGRCISCGVSSVCEPPFDKVVNDARVLDRGLKMDEEEEGVSPGGELEAVKGKAGCDGERLVE